MKQQEKYLTINQERENRFNKAMYQLDVMLNSEKRQEDNKTIRGHEDERR